jgi:hypothetical protein
VPRNRLRILYHLYPELGVSIYSILLLILGELYLRVCRLLTQYQLLLNTPDLVLILVLGLILILILVLFRILILILILIRDQVNRLCRELLAILRSLGLLGLGLGLGYPT